MSDFSNLSPLEKNVQIIFVIQSFINDYNIPLEFYWTKNSPEGSNAAEVLEYIEKYAIGELNEDNIQKGWFTFYYPQFFNEKNEPLIFSINPENIPRIRLYRKTNMNKAICIYLNAKNALERFLSREINFFILKDRSFYRKVLKVLDSYEKSWNIR